MVGGLIIGGPTTINLIAKRQYRQPQDATFQLTVR